MRKSRSNAYKQTWIAYRTSSWVTLDTRTYASYDQKWNLGSSNSTPPRLSDTAHEQRQEKSPIGSTENQIWSTDSLTPTHRYCESSTHEVRNHILVNVFEPLHGPCGDKRRRIPWDPAHDRTTGGFLESKFSFKPWEQNANLRTH